MGIENSLTDSSMMDQSVFDKLTGAIGDAV